MFMVSFEFKRDFYLARHKKFLAINFIFSYCMDQFLFGVLRCVQIETLG